MTATALQAHPTSCVGTDVTGAPRPRYRTQSRVTYARLPFFALIGCVACTAPHSRSVVADSCSAIVAPPKRLRLSDGSTVVVDGRDAAVRGSQVFLAGAHTTVWPANANATTPPRNTQPLLGLVVDSSGEGRPVLAPAGLAASAHARIVSADEKGWHAVWIEGVHGAGADPLQFSTATVWYGLYDGRGWTEVERIASASHARLLSEHSSKLLASPDGRLAFAYAFVRTSPIYHGGLALRGGIVLLERLNGRWRSDTLSTWTSPWSVQLLVRSRGYEAIYAQEYFANGRSRGPALFGAVHGGSWSQEQLLLDVSPATATAPQAVVLSQYDVVSWRTDVPGTDTSLLEWGLYSRARSIRRLGVLARLSSMDDAAVVRIAPALVGFLVRADTARSRLRLFVARHDTAMGLGDFSAPLDNFAPLVASLPGGRLLLFSGGLAKDSSQPPAASYVTAIAVRCPSS